MERYEFVVSACLAGRNCKYDGGSNPCPHVVELAKKGRALPLCPETMGGLPRPREAAEQKDGKIFSRSGEDWTGPFNEGAEKALEQALKSGAKKAILKSNSPSCGCGQIYDGTFSRVLVAGHGVWAKKLLEHNFEIYTEINLPDLKKDD